MGVIDSQQAFTAFPHLSLRRKEIFGRGFIAELRVRGDVAQAIESGSFRFRNAADESAALRRSSFASMGDHCIQMFATELKRRHGQSSTTRRCSSSNCFGSTWPGASIMRSAAEAVFGNAITSRKIGRAHV